MLPHFKNIGNDKGPSQVCGDWWTDLWNQNCWFPKHKDYLTVKGRREENRNEGNINIPKALDGWPVNEEDLLSPCGISFKFLNEALTYAHYHFEKKTVKQKWNDGVFENLLFFKECGFQCYWGLSTGARNHGSNVWQKYEEFGIDIIAFANTPMHLLYLGIKKLIISMIPTLLK